MTKPMIIRGHNPFGRKGRAKGGQSVADAVRRAEAGLAKLLPRILAELDVRIAALEARFGPGVAGRRDEPVQALYTCALGIIEVSNGLPGSGVDEAAKALCELVSRSGDQVDWDAVDVHVATIRLLRVNGQALPAPERQKVLGGLRAIADKYRAPDPAA
jgi:hypothetical protein